MQTYDYFFDNADGQMKLSFLNDSLCLFLIDFLAERYLICNFVAKYTFK